jgi:hypothetical protein
MKVYVCFDRNRWGGHSIPLAVFASVENAIDWLSEHADRGQYVGLEVRSPVVMKAKRMKCGLCGKRRMCSGRPMVCRVCSKLTAPDVASREIHPRLDQMLSKWEDSCCVADDRHT